MTSPQNNAIGQEIPQTRFNFDSLSFLIAQQANLRLRHLTQVIGCNLSLNDDCSYPVPSSPLPAILHRRPLTEGFYITLETEKKVYFTSELQANTNPVWDRFDLTSFFPLNLLSLKGIVIRVWLRREKSEPLLVFSWGVNFSGLLPIGSSLNIPRQEIHPNTLIFKLSECYYTSAESLVSSSGSPKSLLYKSFSLPLSETKPSCSVASMCRLHALKISIRKLEQKCEACKQSLERLGIEEHSKKIIIQKKVEDLRISVTTLKRYLAVERDKVASLRESASNQDALNEDKALELLGYYQLLSRRWNQIKSSDRMQLKKNLSHLNEINGKVKDRRHHLLSQLPFIFPIEQTPKEEHKFSICGVYLPDAEKYEGQPYQSLSVAIGYVSQLLVNIAHIVNIPLRFPITPFGSLSSIADLTSTQLQETGKTFQLYTRGKEREKLHFNYAVFLLNKNIAQLRWCSGIDTKDLRPTLYNLWTLFSLYSNSRAVMPDTPIASPYIADEQLESIETPFTLLQHQNIPAKTPFCLENQLLKLGSSFSLPQSPTSPRKIKNYKRTAVQSSSPLTCSSELLEKQVFSVSSQSESDLDNGSSSACEFKFDPNHKDSFRGKHTHENELSQSLDHGLDSICKKGSSISNISKSTDAALSYPDISVEETRDQADLRDQTTQILRSWHEDEPSPYSSIVASCSSEKLDSGKLNKSEDKTMDKTHSTMDPIAPSTNNTEVTLTRDISEKTAIDKDLVNNCINEEAKKEEAHSPPSPLTHNKDDIDSNFDLLNAFGDKFLTDVAFGAELLANQNCSFKLSFSRQSTQE